MYDVIRNATIDYLKTNEFQLYQYIPSTESRRQIALKIHPSFDDEDIREFLDNPNPNTMKEIEVLDDQKTLQSLASYIISKSV